MDTLMILDFETQKQVPERCQNERYTVANDGRLDKY